MEELQEASRKAENNTKNASLSAKRVAGNYCLQASDWFRYIGSASREVARRGGIVAGKKWMPYELLWKGDVKRKRRDKSGRWIEGARAKDEEELQEGKERDKEESINRKVRERG